MAKRVRHGSANGRKNAFTTPEGGIAEFYTNNTGAPSVGGLVVKLDTTDRNVTTTAISDLEPIGVIYDADWNVGVANGSEIAVVTEGNANALLEDGTAATAGNWVQTSDVQAGRINATSTGAPGGLLGQLFAHFQEMGHCEETKIAGTDVICEIHLHPN